MCEGQGNGPVNALDNAIRKNVKKDFRVIDLNNDTITLDGNHYLAGKELVYKIRILDVRESTPFDKEQAQINMLNG